MSLIKFDTAYVSCSCNLTPCSADWGRNNLIAYGTCNATALYDTKKFSDGGKVIRTIHTNNSRVNAVCWIRTPDGSPENEGVSGSSDGKVVVWCYSTDRRYTLEGHTMTVTVVDGLHLPQKTVSNNSEPARWDTIVASASADSTVKIWMRIDSGLESSQFECIKTLNLGYSICMSLRLCVLPGTQSLVLACATDDSKVQLYAENKAMSQRGSGDADIETDFVKVDTLSGHEDWVRALDFTQDDDGEILLASGSQDSMIRLWRISPRSELELQKPRHELGPLDEIEAEERVFKVDCGDGTCRHFAVALESVLSGHEGWIYGLSWHPAVFEGGTKVHQPMKLLSCSMDKTMIVWAPDAECGVWLDSVRVGDVGGNTLGLYGCKYAPDGRAVMAHGYQGAFHVWNYSETSDRWEPGVTCGGHFREAVEVQWDPQGEFLVSAGADQTTRLHAPWVRAAAGDVAWHEIARPQVHGFDMTCMAVISRNRFASGAEEKVIRAFAAPLNFVDNVARISGVVMDNKSCAAQGASVPSLGLSNKAVYGDEPVSQGTTKAFKDQTPEGYFKPVDLIKPPTEDILLQNTLWPEIQKLYGHGYEIYSLAARGDGRLLASACKATTAEHAAIILWETDNWREIQRLHSHTLTVTQLSFSPDARHLLSVSRDRTWSLFTRDTDADTYALVARTDKTSAIHSRIIWCCAWSHDSKCFATGSREGRVVLWGPTGRTSDTSLGGYASISTFVPLKDDSITSISFAPDLVALRYLVAVGMNSGLIVIYKWSPDDPEKWTECMSLDQHQAHHLTVKRVAFRPVFGIAGVPEGKPDNRDVLQLASCGSDHAVKIYNIYLNSL